MQPMRQLQPTSAVSSIFRAKCWNERSRCQTSGLSDSNVIKYHGNVLDQFYYQGYLAALRTQSRQCQKLPYIRQIRCRCYAYQNVRQTTSSMLVHYAPISSSIHATLSRRCSQGSPFHPTQPVPGHSYSPPNISATPTNPGLVPRTIPVFSTLIYCSSNLLLFRGALL
jgi:hypothetical protein